MRKTKENNYPIAVHLPSHRMFGNQVDTNITLRNNRVEITDRDGIMTSFPAAESCLTPGILKTYSVEPTSSMQRSTHSVKEKLSLLLKTIF